MDMNIFINFISILISFILGYFTSYYFWLKSENGRKIANAYKHIISKNFIQNPLFLNTFDTESLFNKINNLGENIWNGILWDSKNLSMLSENKTLRAIVDENMELFLIFFSNKKNINVHWSVERIVKNKIDVVERIKINNIKIQLIINFIRFFSESKNIGLNNKKIFLNWKYKNSINKILRKDNSLIIFNNEVEKKIKQEFKKYEQDNKLIIENESKNLEHTLNSPTFLEEFYISGKINDFLQKNKYLSKIILNHFKIKLKNLSELIELNLDDNKNATFADKSLYIDKNVIRKNNET